MGRRRDVAARTGQDRKDFAEALALLVEYFSSAPDFMDLRRAKVYDHGLREIPGALVKQAALYATETRTFFPRVVELKADAEYCRQKLLAEHRFVPCASCVDTTAPGWLRVFDSAGVERLRRCDCWQEWRARLEQLGVPATPLMLSAPERELERARTFQGED